MLGNHQKSEARDHSERHPRMPQAVEENHVTGDATTTPTGSIQGRVSERLCPFMALILRSQWT